MGKANNAVNQLLERKEIFADFINGIIFNGEQILNPKNMELLSTNAGFYYEEDNKKKLIERHGDIRMKSELGTYSIIILEESQDSVHYGMPVRKMLYEALEYMKQIYVIEKKHKEQGDKLEKEEFTSGMRKEDKLLPVVSVVFYYKNNKVWDGSKSIYEMLDIDETMPGYKEVKSLLPDYHLNLIEVNDVKDVKKFKTSLQHIFGMLKLNKDKKALYQYTENNRNEMRKMDYIEKQAAYILLGEQKRIEQVLASYTEQEKEEMEVCQAIDELIKDGELRGIQIGEERGIKILIIDNLEEGRTENQILSKLVRRYNLTNEKAKEYYTKYATA